MKRSTICIFIELLFIIVLLGGCEKEASMIKFESDQGRFSVLMPETPEEQERSIDTPVGAVTEHAYTVLKVDTATAYFVSYTDYPDVFAENPDELLKFGVDVVLESVQGKLISEEEVFYDEDPARELHYKAKNDTLLVHSIVILSGNRIYHVAMMSHKNIFNKEMSQKFVDSFEIW